MSSALRLVPNTRTEPITNAETVRIGRWIHQSTGCATNYPPDLVEVRVVGRTDPLPGALVEKIESVIGPFDQVPMPD
jgi:hypothetical protein